MELSKQEMELFLWSKNVFYKTGLMFTKEFHIDF